MQAINGEQTGRGRLHIVFVPGFGGFDALGQLEYYAGTTGAFDAWRRMGAPQGAAGSRTVLHYFPNLPTAGVRTRATLLGRFLAKRQLRNVFQPQDRIALIGHSTGGLDIRQLLIDLDGEHRGAMEVAGSEGDASGNAASGGRLLNQIERVVFLSVPQRGTNIANWVKNHGIARDLLIGGLRVAVDGADAPGFDIATAKLGMLIGRMRNLRAVEALEEYVPDLLRAAFDTGAEATLRTSPDPVTAALGRSALSELNLWLSHSYGDFLAIDDLAANDPPTSVLARLTRPLKRITELGYRAIRFRRIACGDDQTNLSHCTAAARGAECAMWRREGIVVRSYATRAPAPLDRTPRKPGRLHSVLEVLALAGQRDPDTDVVYRLVHTACSAGPFERTMVETTATPFRGGDLVRVTPWDNDGIVNTGSMLWPNGNDTRLINADHADIIGHYRLVPSGQREGRRYQSYDLFRSGAGFDPHAFQAVWSDVFDFCTEANVQAARGPHAPQPSS